jgi:hypothetical protein
MNEPDIPQNNMPHGQMIAHYKDRLSLLVRIDAFENTDEIEGGRFFRKRNKSARVTKSRQEKSLIANLKKRLQALDKN